MPGDTLKQGLACKFQKKDNPSETCKTIGKTSILGIPRKKTDLGILRLFETLQKRWKTKVSEQPGRYVTAEGLCGPLRRARRSQWHTAKTNGKTTIPGL